MQRFWLFAGAVSAFLSVSAGAFGAHALRGKLSPDLLTTFETGARYQMYHALALLAVGVIGLHTQSLAAKVAGTSFILGTILFSGSLYVLALSGVRWLGAITPFGGVAFLVGWIALAVAALRMTIT